MLRRGTGVKELDAAANAVNKQVKKLERVGFYKGLPPEKVADANAQLVTKLTEQAKRAEAIAFVTVLHAAFEAFLYDMFRVVAHFKRDKVLDQLGQRKLEVHALRTTSFDELLNLELTKWVHDRTRRPLMENWKALLSFVPPTGSLKDISLPYDEEWLSKFDLARQDAVHHGGYAIGAFADSLSLYKVRKSVEFLWIQVGEACGIKSEQSTAPHPLVERIAIVHDVHDRIIGAIATGKPEVLLDMIDEAIRDMGIAMETPDQLHDQSTASGVADKTSNTSDQ